MAQDEISQNTKPRDFRIPLSLNPYIDEFYQKVLTEGFLFEDKVFEWAKKQIPSLPQLPSIPVPNPNGDCVECTEQLAAINLRLERIALSMEIDRVERAGQAAAIISALQMIAGRVHENTDAVDTSNSYTMQTRYARRTWFNFAVAFYDLFAWFFGIVVVLFRDGLFHWKGYELKNLPKLEEGEFEELPIENTQVKVEE